MRKIILNPDFQNGLGIEHAESELATTAQYAVPKKDQIDVNDKAWNHMYGAMVDGLGVSPNNFQLIYPYTTWAWPVANRGYTDASQWDFCSNVPQFSATGQYTSAGKAFNDAYISVLNVVAADTSDPVLQEKINAARDQLTLATNYYDKTYQQAKEAYEKETGGTNDPSFTAWLGSYGGKSWAAQLDSAGKNVDAQQAVLNQLISETETPGLKEAIDRYENKDYYTKFEDDTLENFPLVPGYSISMTSAEWLQKVQAGTGGSSGSIAFENSEAQYDYKKTWAGGSTSINRFFWSVKVGGSWERIEEFANDKSLKVMVSFQAWDQISIDAGRWYNGAFIDQIKNGPFIRGYSAYGEDGNQAVWGENGIMGVQKVGMLVCYKPSFTISVSESSFSSFYEKWEVSGGLRIGPFSFGGGGGGTSSGWKADSATKTFTGTSTSETPLIMGVMINQINPKS